MIKIYIGLNVKYQSFMSDCNETQIFSIDFRKIQKYQISWKSVQWEPSYYTLSDGETNVHDAANSRFSQFFESAQKLL